MISIRKFMNALRGLGIQAEAPAVEAGESGSTPVTEETASAAPAGEKHGHVFSVRTKGLVVFGALIAYAIIIALFVFHQKNLLQRDFEEIQKSLEIDSMLKQADTAAFHAVMAVFANVDSPDREAGMQRIQMHYQMLRTMHAALKERLPEFDLSLAGVNAALAEADREATRASMTQLIVELVKTKNEFTNLAEQSQLARRRMSEGYRMQTDSVAMTTLLMGMMGLALLGAISGLFFKRLTEDLRTLQIRALEIVNGYRGEPIPIRRHDEVGQLMMAVNSMATILDKREKELIVERQKYFHQEKMAAIGALAAGVAHEIGNPIAAIAGIAQDMAERRAEGLGPCAHDHCRPCRPDLIQAQTERLAAITREISEFASPQPAEPQLIDLNSQLRSTASLIRYDKRLRRVELRLELDHYLPAIFGVADQVTQVIMNLLINAMDALDPVMDRPPTIIITTKPDGDRVCMTVEDNGPGMEKEVLERVFEAFFTTKPAGKGTGLGLSLCYSIMKNHGGSIDIESVPGKGTRVLVYFPTNETA
ncbi:HAMP domain-containing sensor histidine kinase [Noviherbaspirillum sp.]|uniref:sensor histidine kinase n=1 Tax=Noviherbaspirillum sp. TaxID=1926288 RepID=UPI002B4A94A3|nr:HAMP domain-containing sensor histidine kinase [Noviherbaspirillum sp.]HJV81310.1 HAMP domain-containing sensor histidine kinase [Noviherbaspirillum sp.]